jgi:hypothetical protein
MRRFAGRPWLAAACASFIASAVSLFVFPPLWPILVSIGLACLTVDIARPEPPPPADD